MSVRDGLTQLPGPPPFDSEGYVQTFSANDGDALTPFFARYGFVAIHGVLDDEACEATLDGFYRRAELLGLVRDDPSTWPDFWSQQQFGHFGIVGAFPEVGELEQLRNRCDPRVHAAFAAVIGTERLWVDHDRLGVMLPTLTSQGQPTGVNPTVGDWLHLDCNPGTGSHPRLGFASIGGFEDDGTPIDFSQTLIVQGLLTLTDARAEDGGFHCVPGSHRVCPAWAAENQLTPGSSGQNMNVPPGDPLRAHVVQIPVRRGCLLVWTSLLFHGNHPNRSDRLRAVQYIRMMPTEGTPYRPLVSNPDHLPRGFERTTLSDRLLGISAW